MTIEDYLLGLWTNQNQAQSAPTTYATILMEWKEIEGGFQSKNYYRTDGSQRPYRKRYHKKVDISEKEVLIENYDLEWNKSEECGMLFKYDNLAWHGNIVGDCVHNGVTIKSQMHLFGDKLHSFDQAYKGGRMVWGSNNIYKFVRTKNDF
tara:strand:- start:95 stop:544 length:450 start_codon:yes stop_codon:yes gene_type:complete